MKKLDLIKFRQKHEKLFNNDFAFLATLSQDGSQAFIKVLDDNHLTYNSPTKSVKNGDKVTIEVMDSIQNRKLRIVGTAHILDYNAYAKVLLDDLHIETPAPVVVDIDAIYA